MDAALVGKVLDGRYQVLEPIGAGGVGVVYRARRLNLDRTVAVKVLHESLVQNADFLGRFQRETIALSRLHHPHCVAVTDFGVYESRPYLVLEYVPGENVARLLERGAFTARRAVKIALQLLEALEYFHREHLVHRDLKSENVMLIESAGMSDFVKVLDFGMAKILEGPGADTELSKIGLLPGTPSAMAPEQIQQLPPDPRIDIYATGVLLYEMIVGHRPFRSHDMAAVVRMQLSERPRPPREILGEAALSAELERVILRALEKDRNNRYASASEMADALRLVPEGRLSTSHPAVALPTPVAGVPRGGLGRRLVPIVLGGVLAVGAGLVAGPMLKGRLQGTGTMPVAPAPTTMAAAARALSLPPPPAPVAEPWLAHRDLAVTYTGQGRQDDAFREVKAAVKDNAEAAGADPSLVDAAVAALSEDRVSFVVSAFRSNPRLVEALAAGTAGGATADLRHAAYDGLRMIGQESRADLVAMGIRDLEQATRCSSMKSTFKKLRGSRDPRVQALVDDLRGRGRKDPHVKCLGRHLRRR